METIEHLAARASLFKYLSLGFSPPGTISFPELFAHLREACASLPPGHRELLAPILETEIPQWSEEDYGRLFGPGGVVSIYETEYDPLVAVRKGHELSDLLGFYTAFGFELRGDRHELPDHLAVELEFMSLLLVKLLYARQRGMEEAQEVTYTAIASFLRDHLGRWVEAFAEAVDQARAFLAYELLARIVRDLVGEECRLSGIDPIPMSGAARRAEEEVACPFVTKCGQENEERG